MTTALGMVTSSLHTVLTFVESMPSCVTVPSTSPIRTKSPSAKRARVGDHEAAHDLRDQAARAQRDHEAEQHADALERVGLAARHVRIHDDDGEEPRASRQQPACRLHGLRMEPARRRDAAALDRVEPESDQLDDEAREQQDEGDGDQARNRVHDAESEVPHGRQEESGHRLAPGTRERKPPQDERDGGVGDEQLQADGRSRNKTALEVDQARGAQEAHVRPRPTWSASVPRARRAWPQPPDARGRSRP